MQNLRSKHCKEETKNFCFKNYNLNNRFDKENFKQLEEKMFRVRHNVKEYEEND